MQSAQGRLTTPRPSVTVLDLKDRPAGAEKAGCFESSFDRRGDVLGVDCLIRDDDALGDLGNDGVPESFSERAADEDAAETDERRRPGVGREGLDILCCDRLPENCFSHHNFKIARGSVLPADG